MALTRLSCALRFFGNQRKCWQHLEGKFVINTVYRTREARNSEISKLRWEINSSLCHNICSAACRARASNGRHVVPPRDIIRYFCYLWHGRKTLIKCYGRLDRTIFYLGKNTSLRVWSFQRRYNATGLSSQTNAKPISHIFMYMSCKMFEDKSDYSVYVCQETKQAILRSFTCRSINLWFELAMTEHIASPTKRWHTNVFLVLWSHQFKMWKEAPARKSSASMSTSKVP